MPEFFEKNPHNSKEVLNLDFSQIDRLYDKFQSIIVAKMMELYNELFPNGYTKNINLNAIKQRLDVKIGNNSTIDRSKLDELYGHVSQHESPELVLFSILRMYAIDILSDDTDGNNYEFISVKHKIEILESVIKNPQNKVTKDKFNRNFETKIWIFIKENTLTGLFLTLYLSIFLYFVYTLGLDYLSSQNNVFNPINVNEQNIESE